MAWLRKAPLAPCPACDAPLEPGGDAARDGRCPHCDTPLTPVVVARAWRRFAAGFLDLALLALTAGPLHYLLTRLAPGVALAPGARGWDAALTIFTLAPGVLLLRVAPFLVMCGLYLFLFATLSGKTPGQSALGVRVVDGAGGSPHPLRSLLRLAGLLLGVLPLGLGVLWVWFDMERRALHDHLAGTWLVRDLDQATTPT